MAGFEHKRRNDIAGSVAPGNTGPSRATFLNEAGSEGREETRVGLGTVGKAAAQGAAASVKAARQGRGKAIVHGLAGVRGAATVAGNAQFPSDSRVGTAGNPDMIAMQAFPAVNPGKLSQANSERHYASCMPADAFLAGESSYR